MVKRNLSFSESVDGAAEVGLDVSVRDERGIAMSLKLRASVLTYKRITRLQES